MNVNQKYINAVFNFDLDAFKNLLDTEPFEESLLKDINFSEDVLCPIYWMTQCWEIIFEHPEEWSEQKKHIIEENKRRNLEIKRLFEKKFNIVSDLSISITQTFNSSEMIEMITLMMCSIIRKNT